MTNANDPSHPPLARDTASPDQLGSSTASSPSEIGESEKPTSEATIPLPARTPTPRQPSSPEQFAKEMRRLDRVLVVVGCVLAFLLASFPIRNSDYWLHAATGRLLAGGNYRFGSDPFAYTTQGSYWANHSWLFDLGLYAIANLAGGPDTSAAGIAMVVAKGLVTVAIFFLMIGIRRPDQSLWGPAVLAVLGVLAMSPRLFVQPTVISILFVALTLFILVRPASVELPSRGGRRKDPLNVYWLLAPLFVLWVNLDGWFILGPAIVLLYLVGQLVQSILAPIRTGADAPEPNLIGRLSLVLVVGVAACLINPHHYHAFSLPAHLSWSGPRELLRADPVLNQLFQTPVDVYLAKETGRMSGAGVAYFLLLGLGFISFALGLLNGWRWWRLFVWLPFAVLGAYQVSNVAFFAVIAAPITALNIHDFVTVRFPSAQINERSLRLGSLTGRLASILAGVLLVAAAWPGWLHGMPGDPRLTHRVGWSVLVDPSLKGVAEQIKDWRSKGLIKPDENGLNYNPDIVNYCAWFCADEHGLPTEKGFFDSRLQLFSDSVGKDYLDVRRALRESPTQTGDSPTFDWQGVFGKYGIGHVLLTTLTNESVEAGQHLLKEWSQWRLVYLDGRSSVFCWNHSDDQSSQAKGVPRLNLNALAFGADPEKAPAANAREPQPPNLWVQFRDGPPVRPLDVDKSARYHDYYAQVSEVWPVPAFIGSELGAWGGIMGAVPSTPAATWMVPATLLLKPLPIRGFIGIQQWLPLFMADKDLGPPAALILSVRAARRAIKESPDNAAGYSNLAQAYLRMASGHEDRWQPIMRQEQQILTRQKLRQVQIATALEQALKLSPADSLGHFKLSSLYEQLHYYDLAADHLEDAIKLFQKQGAPVGLVDSQGQFDQVMERLQKRHKDLGTFVLNQRNEYEVSSTNRPPLQRAQLALSKGLAKQARDVLNDITTLESSAEAISLNVDLLLSTGNADELRRDFLGNEDLKRALAGVYDHYEVLLAAATGNYDEAAAALDQIIRQTEASGIQLLLTMARLGTFQGVLTPATLRGLNTFPDVERQLADLRSMRGLLSLEQGDNASAAKFFRQAIDSADTDQLEFNGRVFANRYLRLLDQAGGARQN
jgi:tetratricopeptide (TPR) repeat protein